MSCPVGKTAVMYTGTHMSNPDIKPISFTHCVDPSVPLSDAVLDDMRDRVADEMAVAVPDVIGADIEISLSTTMPDPVSMTDFHKALQHNMSRSCGPAFDASEAGQLQVFNCYYHGPYKSEDGAMRSVRLKRSGRLMSCDSSREDSERTGEDVRHIAHHKMGGDERGVDLNKIYCDIMTQPTL